MNVSDPRRRRGSQRTRRSRRGRAASPRCARTCRACPVVHVCGGGLYAHRFRPGPRARRGPAWTRPSSIIPRCTAPTSRRWSARCWRPSGIPGRGGPGPAAATSAVPDEPVTRPVHELPDGAFDSLASGPGDVASIVALADVRMSEVRTLAAAVAASEADWLDPDLRRRCRRGLGAAVRIEPRPIRARSTRSSPTLTPTRGRYGACAHPPAPTSTWTARIWLALAAAAAFRAGIPAELPLASPRRLRAPAHGRRDRGRSRPGPHPGRDGLAGRAADGARRRPVAQGTLPERSSVPPAGGRGSRPVSRLPALARREPPVSSRNGTPGDETSPRPDSTWPTPFPATPGASWPGCGPWCRCVRPPPARGAPRRGRRSAPWPSRGPAIRRRDGELSGLLLHEFQHVKLNVLLDLHALSQPGSRARFRVPWRDEPRPPEAALHGTYAFLALTHLRRAEGPASRATYLRYRSWVCGAADDLLSATGVLTSAGERFVSGMAAAAESAVI